MLQCLCGVHTGGSEKGSQTRPGHNELLSLGSDQVRPYLLLFYYISVNVYDLDICYDNWYLPHSRMWCATNNYLKPLVNAYQRLSCGPEFFVFLGLQTLKNKEIDVG